MAAGCRELAGAHARLVQNDAGEVAQRSLCCTALSLGATTSDPLDFGIERLEHVLAQCSDSRRQPILISHALEHGGRLAHVGSRIVGRHQMLHGRMQPHGLEVEQLHSGHIRNSRLDVARQPHVDHDLPGRLSSTGHGADGCAGTVLESEPAAAQQGVSADRVPLARRAGDDDVGQRRGHMHVARVDGLEAVLERESVLAARRAPHLDVVHAAIAQCFQSRARVVSGAHEQHPRLLPRGQLRRGEIEGEPDHRAVGAAYISPPLHDALRLVGALKQSLEIACCGAQLLCSSVSAAHLTGDLVFADDDGFEPRGYGEQMLGGVAAHVHFAHGGNSLSSQLVAHQRGRIVAFGVGLEVHLEPVARADHHGTAHGHMRSQGVAQRIRVEVREGFEHGEIVSAVADCQSDEHGETHTSLAYNAETMTTSLPAEHPLRTVTSDSRLIRAYRGERPDVLPVWFMRQAGSSLPEYRELRKTAEAGADMLDTCLVPELASEITLQPVRRHGVDAGIFFSDIMIPLRLAGVDVRIESGVGPIVGEAVQTPDAVDRIVQLELTHEALAPIREAVALTVAELNETGTPLIGFAGAPFTLAAYLVAGRPTKDHLPVRTFMRRHPEAWSRLAEWAAKITGEFLRTQVMAGASAAQLFDSWAGSLSRDQYVEHVVGHSRAALDPVRELGVPLVHFGVGAGEIYGDMNIGVDTIGVDWRVPLDEAVQRMQGDVTVQGNLDPAVLAAGWDAIEPAVRDVAERGRAARAHVFNLGHGVPPETDPAQLTRIVELVHSL